MHFDTDRKVDSRRLTAILYLNPSWSSSIDGGSLRLYPFPHAPISISPIHDRLVLFDSARMLHRVVPTRSKERVCITVWFWQEDSEWRATPKPCSSTTEFTHQRDSALSSIFSDASPTELYTLTHLLSSAYLPHLTKLYHTHEWFTSLEESHSLQRELASETAGLSTSDHVSEMLVRHLGRDRDDRTRTGRTAEEAGAEEGLWWKTGEGVYSGSSLEELDADSLDEATDPTAALRVRRILSPPGGCFGTDFFVRCERPSG